MYTNISIIKHIAWLRVYNKEIILKYILGIKNFSVSISTYGTKHRMTT